MDEDQARVDGFSGKTDTSPVKARDGGIRSTKTGQGRKAKPKKQLRINGSDAEKQLRVVYTCQAHSDAALAELVEFLARSIVGQEEMTLSTEEPSEIPIHKSA